MTSVQVPPVRTRLRRFGPLGLVVVGVLMLVALAASLLLPSRPLAPAVPWYSASSGGGPAFRPNSAQTATVILVRTQWWPACPPYDEMIGNVANSSWLTQEIAYTSSSVTITLRVRHTDPPVKCASFYDYWGLPVEVLLSEPVGGRALLDGSSDPAAVRPYR